MFTLPLNDTQAIAIDDADEDTWQVHHVDFAARSITRVAVDGIGRVTAAHYDAGRKLLWLIVGGRLFAMKDDEVFDVPMPDDEAFFAYTVVGDGPAVYVAGEYSNLWRVALPSMDWEPVLKPPPPPEDVDDEALQSAQTKDYARRHPPLYAGFKHGDDFMFAGALGTVVRLRNGVVEQRTLPSGHRFVSGRAEGGRVSLSADSQGGSIVVGDFDGAFEVLFQDSQPALHRTALHAGRRYIGVAEYPPSSLHNLYTHDGTGLSRVTTGCAREPGPLISLQATEHALFAVDAGGVFRLSNGAWTLVDENDLERETWPA